ncbi:hypothetical protein Tco_0595067 [Tanacetum coccineum]
MPLGGGGGGGLSVVGGDGGGVDKSTLLSLDLWEGHRVDYGFISTIEAEARRQRAEAVGYGIRDTWVDPRKATEEITPVTIEGVNTRVTELAAVREQDT